MQQHVPVSLLRPEGGGSCKEQDLSAMVTEARGAVHRRPSASTGACWRWATSSMPWQTARLTTCHTASPRSHACCRCAALQLRCLRYLENHRAEPLHCK